MNKKKSYGIVLILLGVTIISFFLYQYTSDRADANHLKNAKLFVESFGWKAEYLSSIDTSISRQSHEDVEIFSYREKASSDIGLDYLKFNGKKAKLYAFDLGSEYKGKPIYAHVLMYNNQVIGAYIQSQTDGNTGTVYVFSLKDKDLQNPNIK